MDDGDDDDGRDIESEPEPRIDSDEAAFLVESSEPEPCVPSESPLVPLTWSRRR
jgi:hypothetical protein